jgi:hypothetical protein
MKNSKLHNGVGDVSSGELHISNGATTCGAMHVDGATRKYSKGEDARKARKQVCWYICVKTKNNGVICGFLPSHLVYENNLLINSASIVLSG